MGLTAPQIDEFLRYGRLLLQLRRYLRGTPPAEGAAAVLRQRLRDRSETFLRSVKRCVFDHPGSPYARLFERACCRYGDLVHEVRRRGLEAALHGLAAAGVRISVDEFKGRAPIVRDGWELPVQPGDFDSPAVSYGANLRSGGSSGRPIRVRKSLEFLAARVPYDQTIFRILDVERVPLALWYPQPPAGAGIDNALRYALAGRRIDRWFDMAGPGRSALGWAARSLTAGVVSASRSARSPIPPPERVPLRNATPVLDWVLRQRARHGRVVLQTYVSQAVRFAQAARQRGIDMDGVLLIVGSEPLTQARVAEIAASGARVFVRYYTSEIGSVGLECLDAAEVGDLHLMHDMIAMIQPDAVDETGERPFLFTSLLDVMPKVMINTSLGDVGMAAERECGCPLGRLGFTTHLSRVRSVRRVTCEGMGVPVADLTRIVEDVVRPRYGGSTLDYQWAERERPDGHGRLQLRVSPAVGPVDEAALVSDILSELSRVSRASGVAASVWRQAGTIEIVRRKPAVTASVKTPAFAGE